MGCNDVRMCVSHHITHSLTHSSVDRLYKCGTPSRTDATRHVYVRLSINVYVLTKESTAIDPTSILQQLLQRKRRSTDAHSRTHNERTKAWLLGLVGRCNERDAKAAHGRVDVTPSLYCYLYSTHTGD
eukprot:GHVU01224463.1.p1 GENE.GHVU01224463.1~~GHVU01224463.1.p1  ORF type:complete len:128 (-),score=10.01 GHVU01224463.1:194-577(-)